MPNHTEATPAPTDLRRGSFPLPALSRSDDTPEYADSRLVHVDGEVVARKPGYYPSGTWPLESLRPAEGLVDQDDDDEIYQPPTRIIPSDDEVYIRSSD